jgi:hypothetical protein
MSFHSTVFSQVLQQVNRYNFNCQVSKYKGDKGSSKFDCFSILVIMFFMQLKSKASLRDVTTGMNIFQNNFYHLGMNKISRLSHSSLSDAMRSRPYEVFESYFYELLDKAYLYKSTKGIKGAKRLRKILKLIDSTTISLCKNMYDWAKFRKTKSGIKLHTVFNADLLAPVQILITNAKKHDVSIVDEIEIKKGEMYVFDRGYNCFKYWNNIDLAGAFFVTRLKKNAKYHVLKKKVYTGRNGVLSDRIIKIKGTNANDYNGKLRLVKYYDKETNKTFDFVTNDFKTSSKEIADIYKARWGIELFFKWIKQHLKIKKIISTSENGLKVQIWCAMILYLSLLLIKLECRINIDLFEVYRRIQDALFERIEVFRLITNRFEIPEKIGVEEEAYLW